MMSDMTPAHEHIARVREANRHDLYTIGQRWADALALCDAYEALAEQVRIHLAGHPYNCACEDALRLLLGELT